MIVTQPHLFNNMAFQHSLYLMFKCAIVKTPCQAMIDGITEAQLGLPDYELALQQHQNYIQALQECGVGVTLLPAEEAYPDSCFVEDPAIITSQCAIITRSATNSRNGETVAIEKAVSDLYSKVDHIQAPGTLDGGDVMMVGDHFYIGLSARTNQHGANQLLSILEKYAMTGSYITLSEMLHLKTGLSYLENNYLLAAGEFLAHEAFQDFKLLPIDNNESYAANCIWVNGTVLAPMGFPKSQAMLEKAGFEVLTVDVSEFQKLDGGLSCLSLRF